MPFLKSHARGLAWMGAYGAAWAISAALLFKPQPESFADAISVFVVMGVVFSLLAWGLTLGRASPAIPVRRPRLELAAVLAFLAAYAVFFTGYGLNAFHAAFPAVTRTSALALMALKLAVHVAAPALLLTLLGAELRPLFASRAPARTFWAALVGLGGAALVMMCVVSPSLAHLRALHLAPASLALALAGAFGWLAIEAGLCEEFLFRAVLQTRLAAVLKTEMGAACVAAVLFALAHVPGLWMRSGADTAGHSADLVQVIAYAVATLSPAGLFLGVVWSRTRSLLLVVLLHALIDVLPNTPDFARLWMGA
ncbi:MAG: CPBP family intramembrane metalloprotease [Proteobacteria bacterium]|nr:CPBP family intramembrane metalloprotease [Pseudomonadota bacterium]